MRIGVDCRPLLRDEFSGIPAYVKGILTSIARFNPEHEFVLYAPGKFDFELPNNRWKKRYGSMVRNGTMWMQLELPSMVKQDNLDIYWGTQNVLPLRLDTKIKTVLTVHDVMYRIYPELMAPYNYWIQKLFFMPSLNKADAVVAISHSTMRDMERFFPVADKQRFVIWNGMAKHFNKPSMNGKSPIRDATLNGSPKYILVVGTFEPRKNLVRVIQAFTKIASKIPHNLVIVGPKGWKNKHLELEVSQCCILDRIQFIGYVEDKRLPNLYTAADVFVFASLYEGFGLPPLEAMACGVPVVCSNASSLPEVVGDAALQFDPHSVEQIAETILKVISEDQLKAEMKVKSLEQAKRFSWDLTGRKMLDVFEQVGLGQNR